MPQAISFNSAIHYEVIDAVAPASTDPATVLFIHGIGAHRAIWRDWLPHLIGGYRVVSFDLRGYGLSRESAPDFQWCLRNLAADAIAVADAVGPGPVHLVGESIGGTIALEAAIGFPDRCASITVSNGGHVGSSIERVRAWDEQIRTGGIKAWSDDFMQQRFHPGALSPRQRAWYGKVQEAWEHASIMNLLTVLVGTDLRPRLGEIACPVLILHPDDSPFIPVEIAVDLYRRLQRAQLQVIAGSRHGMPYSHSRECAVALRKFLDHLPPPA